MSGVLTKQVFQDFFMEFAKRTRPNSRCLVVSKPVADKVDYINKTIVLEEWPGYVKLQGPDGKTWFKKRWKSYSDFGRGEGNKAKRRNGLKAIPIFGSFDEGCVWTKEGE